MTLYHGILLFDVAEDPIGSWENQLGYRGVMEVWKAGDSTLQIEADEDSGGEEVWVHDEEGNHDSLGIFPTSDQDDAAAKAFMRENPEGWR